MTSFQVRYRFGFADGSREAFELDIDERTLELLLEPVAEPPDWTALGFHQCANCPLDVSDHPRCPVAERLAGVVPRFERLLSYDEARVEVEMNERTVSGDTTVQTALSSLIGLVMATSGCPHMAFFKPMARFHLPLATEEETTFRSVSTYLLAQYFMRADGIETGESLDGLKRVYEALSIVNAAVARRLRAAGRTDSTLNALVLLDVFTMIVPAAIEDSLSEIHDLLGPYMRSFAALGQSR